MKRYTKKQKPKCICLLSLFSSCYQSIWRLWLGMKHYRGSINNSDLLYYSFVSRCFQFHCHASWYYGGVNEWQTPCLCLYSPLPLRRFIVTYIISWQAATWETLIGAGGWWVTWLKLVLGNNVFYQRIFCFWIKMDMFI